jgi:hypothetical protein
MKKAIAKETIKIKRTIYPKGTQFTSPYPDGVQAEIDAGTGVVVEEDGIHPAIKKQMSPAKSVRPENETLLADSPEGDASEKETKKVLMDYALHTFGAKIHPSTSIANIKKQIAEMEEAADADNGPAGEPDVELNGI